MANKNPVEIITDIASENGLDLPLIDAKDVRVDNNTRLDGVLTGLDGKFVRHDVEEYLTDAQKKVARDNIGAASASSLSVLEPAATASDVGKALKVKTVSGGKATEYEFGETVTVDATLTQTAMAADAKKTGDEITALGNTISTEEARAKAEEARIETLFTQPVEDAVADWLDAHPEATTTVVTDKTLSVANLAADAKATGDELTGLKDDLNKYDNGIKPFPGVYQYALINIDGEFVARPDHKTVAIETYYTATEGDTITVSPGFACVICEYNLSDEKQSRDVRAEGTYDLNANSKYRISVYYYPTLDVIQSLSEVSSAVYIKTNSEKRFENIESEFNEIQTNVNSLTERVDFNEAWLSESSFDHDALVPREYVKHADGSIGTNYNKAKRTEYIEVVPESVVFLSLGLNSETIPDIIGLAFYDVNKVFVPNSGIDYSSLPIRAQVPPTAHYVMFTIPVSCLSTFYYKNIVDFTPLTAVKAVKKDVIFEYRNNEYIRVNGTLQKNAVNFKRTTPFILKAGDHIKINAKGLTNTLSILSSYSNGDYHSLINSDSNEQKVYEYTIENDGQYVCSFITTGVFEVDVLIYSSGLEEQISRLEDKNFNILAMYDTFICIGDSLTWSQVYTSSQNDNRRAFKTYPQVLASLCGGESYSFATPGDTALLWWQRSSTGAFDHHGLYIVFLGTNMELTNTIDTDCPGTDPDEFAQTQTGQYGRILQIISNNGDHAVLIKPWAGGGGENKLSGTRAVIESFAEKYNFATIDVVSPDKTTPAYHYWPNKEGSNGLHFNDLGYAWFANEVITLINGLPAEEKFKIMRTR